MPLIFCLAWTLVFSPLASSANSGNKNWTASHILFKSDKGSPFSRWHCGFWRFSVLPVKVLPGSAQSIKKWMPTFDPPSDKSDSLMEWRSLNWDGSCFMEMFPSPVEWEEWRKRFLPKANYPWSQLKSASFSVWPSVERCLSNVIGAWLGFIS